MMSRCWDLIFPMIGPLASEEAEQCSAMQCNWEDVWLPKQNKPSRGQGIGGLHGWEVRDCVPQLDKPLPKIIAPNPINTRWTSGHNNPTTTTHVHNFLLHLLLHHHHNQDHDVTPKTALNIWCPLCFPTIASTTLLHCISLYIHKEEPIIFLGSLKPC